MGGLMFNVLSNRQAGQCDGSTRRDFLKAGVLGMGGIGQVKPGFGSILARHRGPNNSTTGLPTYVRMGGILGDGPSWLGSAYAPFDTAGNARNNMNLQVTMDRLSERRGLLRTFDALD